MIVKLKEYFTNKVKKIIKSKYGLFGGIFLTLLVIGISYAYFGHIGNSTNITKHYAAKTKSGPIVTMADSTDLSLNLANFYMEDKGVDVPLYGTSTGVPNNVKIEVPLATIDATDLEISQQCSYTVSVSQTGDFYTTYKSGTNTITGEFVLYIGDNIYDFKTDDMPSTVSGTIKGINNNDIKYLNASLLFLNRTGVDQTYLAGKNMNLKLTITSFSCEDASPNIVINTSWNGTVNSLPTTTLGKEATITGCSGATWNSKYQRFEISSITDDIECNVNYTNPNSTTNLSDYIISLDGTTQGSGEIVNENDNIQDSGYRYEGKNPNNYVWFNNELWRIIGVFGENYHGKSGNLVKIIRDSSIGLLSFNPSGNTVFVGSYIYNILNGAYINKNNTWIDTTNCYGNKYDNITSTCDYTNIGIKSNYLNMVEDAYWLINTVSSTSITKNSSFSTKYKTSNAFKIGLMNASEYAYASNNCTENLIDYDYCIESNWLSGKGPEWTMTPYSSSIVLRVKAIGNLKEDFAPTYGHAVRPTLYLKSNVYKVSGTGSRSDPYILGIS